MRILKGCRAILWLVPCGEAGDNNRGFVFSLMRNDFVETVIISRL